MFHVAGDSIPRRYSTSIRDHQNPIINVYKVDLQKTQRMKLKSASNFVLLYIEVTKFEI